jgi:hypothetical protein
VFDSWEDVIDDLKYTQLKVIESDIASSTAQFDLLFRDACTLPSCNDILNIGIHSTLNEFMSASRSVVGNLKSGLGYTEAGGYVMEQLGDELSPSLFAALE